MVARSAVYYATVDVLPMAKVSLDLVLTNSADSTTSRSRWFALVVGYLNTAVDLPACARSKLSRGHGQHKSSDRLREVVESAEFVSTKSKLTLAMGKDINGRIITADLADMPHLLIAGSNWFGQECGHQCDDHVDPVQGHAGAGALDPG